jgi:hypothetical protein
MISSKKVLNSIARPVAALICGCILATLLALGIEGIFVLNSKYHWLSPMIGPIFEFKSPPSQDQISSLLDKFPHLQELKFNEPVTDYSDPNDYMGGYNFSACSGEPALMQPYWLGKKNCNAHIEMRKKISRRMVYDVHYGMDEHYLRRVPAASKSDKYLVFLGCSFTYGEGQNDEDTFANLVTAALQPTNAFNLGMVGYGPPLTLDLLSVPKDDIRLSAIHGKDGMAIYTFIDNHFARIAGSMNWVINGSNFMNPYYGLENNKLKRIGTFGETRGFTNFIYAILAKSEFLKFFKIDLPIYYSDEDIEIFVQIMREAKFRLKEKFNIEKFIVAVYPQERQFVARFKSRLEALGIVVIDFSHIPISALLKYNDTIPGDGHPSKLAHRLYADLLVEEIKRLKLVN